MSYGRLGSTLCHMVDLGALECHADGGIFCGEFSHVLLM